MKHSYIVTQNLEQIYVYVYLRKILNVMRLYNLLYLWPTLKSLNTLYGMIVNFSCVFMIFKASATIKI